MKYNLTSKNIFLVIEADNKEQAYRKFIDYIDRNNYWANVGGIIDLNDGSNTYPLRTHTIAYLKGILTLNECLEQLHLIFGQAVTELDFLKMVDEDKWILQ